MTSTKLVSKATLNYMLNSYQRRGLKCRLCGTINCMRDSLVMMNNDSSSWPIIQVISRRHFTSLGGSTTSSKATVLDSQLPAYRQGQDKIFHTDLPLNINNNKKYIKFQSIRSTSTTTTSTSPIVGVTSPRRGASTQARQQVKDQPNYITTHESFRCSELEIVKCSPGEMRPKPPVDKLVFGHAFTDHMFRVDWDRENGWSTPLISKIHNLDLHPGAKVFHYALEAFEGAKAYRGHDNKIRFFRLDQNIKRLLHSTRRLALPEFDELELMKCIHKLVQLDQDWIPSVNGRQLTSLYVRPSILGTEPSLGVASSNKAILFVLLSPVGPYFKTGFKPIALYADPDAVRAWPGGAGNTKLGSNYAPTIKVQKQAEKLGLQQVLWLFGEDQKLTEVGTMNIFVTYRNDDTGKIHLVTPPLTDGLILPGITRASILELSRQWGDIICEERYLTIGDIQQMLHEGRLLEMFGSGTACIVCPISSIQMKDGTKLDVPYYDITKPTTHDTDRLVITKRILKSITDIQYGKLDHPWAQELGYC